MEAPAPREIKRRSSVFRNLRRDVAGQSLECLDILAAVDPDRPRGDRDDRREQIRLLEELWGCDFLLWDVDLIERMEGGDRWSVFDPTDDEDEIAAAVWPVDYGVVLPPRHDDDEARKDFVYAVRIATVRSHEVRGLVRQVVPRMIRAIVGRFWPDGTYNCHETYLGLFGKKWVVIDDEMKYARAQRGLRRTLHVSASRIMSLALTARYEWHVAFGAIPGGPRLLLPTNPSAALGLFKYRDLAPGENRRAKLRHWVEEHWREDSTESIAYVVAHLRGETRFAWNDFDCELFVSAFDLEKSVELKKTAATWRSQRRHNRVKIRRVKPKGDRK